MGTSLNGFYPCRPVLWLALAGLAAGLGQAAARGQTPGASQAAHSEMQGTSLPQVIAQLNTAAAKFRSAQADFAWDQYQAVVQEDDIQSGTIYFDHRKDTTVMAAHILQVGGKNAPKFVVYDGKEVQFYQPEIKQMTILRPGSNQAQVESFLTLGFGGSGTDLQANWEITPQGKETMGGVNVIQLDLKPKAANVQKMFTHVVIWVDPARGISLKQIFYEPSGDRRTVTYSNIKYNVPVSKDIFRIKTAPGTTVQVR